MASEALRVAGAKFVNGDLGGGDYTWGTAVTTLSPGRDSSPLAACKPGDILQFQNVRLAGGYIADHHTAVVAAVDSHGRPTKVYQQNVGVNGKGPGVHDRTDRLDAVTINMNTITAGTVHVYRAAPRADALGKVQFTVVNDAKLSQSVTVYFNGVAQGSLSYTGFNTAGSYGNAYFTNSGQGTWSIGVGSSRVALTNAGGYQVYTAANGVAAIRAI